MPILDPNGPDVPSIGPLAAAPIGGVLVPSGGPKGDKGDTGNTGPQGRSITSVTISGNDLQQHMSDSTVESVTVPALTGAAQSASDAAASATAAHNSEVLAYQYAQDAQNGVVPDGAVTTAKIANSAVTWIKLASDVTTGVQSIISGDRGAANGIAPLDSNGLVPSANLPSYVDDVLEYASVSNFPGTGETGKIYVAKDTNKIYRWSGSVYIEISPSPGSTDAVTEGSTNLYYTDSRVQTKVNSMYGSAANTICQGNDSRLSNARTPLAHTHPASEINDSTSVGRSVMTATDAAAARTAIGAGTSSLAIGTTGTTACAGNDSRLSDTRTPSASTVPCDFVWVAQSGTRVTGIGDLATGMYVGRAFTLTKAIYQFDTADASGSTAVELRKNGSQVASSNLSVTAANQADGTSTDSARTATISVSYAVGDRLSLAATSLGTTPGKGLRAYLFGTWN